MLAPIEHTDRPTTWAIALSTALAQSVAVALSLAVVFSTPLNASGQVADSNRQLAADSPVALDDVSSRRREKDATPEANKPGPDDDNQDGDNQDGDNQDGAEDNSASERLSLDDSDDDVEDDDAAENEPKAADKNDNANVAQSDNAFSTDTRGLRVNIREQSTESPADRSATLIETTAPALAVLPSEKIFAWAAPDIRYQPLYFEDVALERYGQTPGGLRQTVLSGIHFFTSAHLLPSQMLERPPCDCDWPLGFCRPGSDVPFVWQKPLAR